MHPLLTGPLSVERLTVPIADLPESLNGTRIVQLSDFHYDGLRLSENLLCQAIAISNQYRPDAIFMTGDFITDDPNPIYELVRYLTRLTSRCGIYAVLGNHELYRSGARTKVTHALKSVGIEVLWNAIAHPFGPHLPVVGLAEFWSKEFAPAPLFQALNPAVPRLVLCHNPDSAAHLRPWRVDLQLSGHTHGGQIVLPGMGSLAGWFAAVRHHIPKTVRRIIPLERQVGECVEVVRNWEWHQGLHQVGTNLLYVNRGLGTYPPGRLFCPPEVTVITLQRRSTGCR